MKKWKRMSALLLALALAVSLIACNCYRKFPITDVIGNLFLSEKPEKSPQASRFSRKNFR